MRSSCQQTPRWAELPSIRHPSLSHCVTSLRGKPLREVKSFFVWN